MASDHWLRAVGDDDYVTSVRYEKERTKLTERLQNGIKHVVSEAFSDPNKIDAIDQTNPSLQAFLINLEDALTHGLRTKLERKKDFGQITFWNYLENVDKFFPASSQMMIKLRKLEKVKTSQAKGRAWLRYALNDACLDVYLTALVSNVDLTATWYEDHAYLCNHSESSFFLSLLTGLNPIKFNLLVDDPDLDYLQLVKKPDVDSDKKKKKKGRKKPTFVRIDDAQDQQATVQTVIDKEVKKKEEEFKKREDELNKREQDILRKLQEAQDDKQRSDDLKRKEEDKKRETEEQGKKKQMDEDMRLSITIQEKQNRLMEQDDFLKKQQQEDIRRREQLQQEEQQMRHQQFQVLEQKLLDTVQNLAEKKLGGNKKEGSCRGRKLKNTCPKSSTSAD